MIIDRFIKKSNVVTDGIVPDRAVLTEKVLNVIYEKFQNEGKRFTITFAELYKLLNLKNHSENKKRLKDSLRILSQSLELKNFTHRNGRKVEWFVGSFMKATIFEDTRDFIDFVIDEDTLFAIEQLKQYTVIDINLSNKFKTKYGITIWQMYLRYKNQNRSGVDKKWTYQTFTLEDLNKKFGTNYKHNSQMQRSIERGLKEIKKITDKDIYVQLQKETNKIGFFWEKGKQIPEHLKSEKAFIAYIREKYMPNPQKDFYPTIHTNDDGEEIKVSNKGLLYGRKDEQTIAYNAKTSQKIWTHFYKMAKEGRKF